MLRLNLPRGGAGELRKINAICFVSDGSDGKRMEEARNRPKDLSSSICFGAGSEGCEMGGAWVVILEV